MQDQYLCATSNVNLSPRQSHNIKILFKCDIWIGHKLGSLRWEIGASLIRYRINKSSKPLWKIMKVTFTKIYWEVLEATLKLKQPFTLFCILSPPLQPRYIPNSSGHQHLSLSCLLYFWVLLPAYISCQLSTQEAPVSWPQNFMPCTTPEMDC